jgi:hypothetical protein
MKFINGYRPHSHKQTTIERYGSATKVRVSGYCEALRI